MSFDLTIPQKLLIARLNLGVRDSSGVATYSTTTANKSWPDEELVRACQTGATKIMRAICESEGHAHRPLFVTSTSLTHGAVIPPHIGTVGVPRITPFSGATYKITGKRVSIEDVSAYRSNPGKQYSKVAHDTANGQYPSKLAGRYAIDEPTNVIYFTGYSAESDLANCVEADYTKLPDLYYGDVANIAIGELAKDGAVSDLFTYYGQLGQQALAEINAGKVPQPSAEPTVGARDSGAK